MERRKFIKRIPDEILKMEFTKEYSLSKIVIGQECTQHRKENDTKFMESILIKTNLLISQDPG